MKLRVFFLFFFGCVTLQLFPNIIYVKQGGTGDGSSWEKAAGDLNKILDNCERYSDDQVWVAQGAYQLTKQLRLRASVDMYGGFTGNETEISDRDLTNKTTLLGGDFGMLVADGDASYQTVIDGFIFKGTNCPVMPENVYGNIYLFQNSVIRNCIITDNLFQKNSALGMEKSLMENCIIYNNTTTDWNAAVDLINGSKVYNCVIVNNTGANGGFRARSNSVIANTILWGNTGNDRQTPCEGYVDDATPRLINCGYLPNFRNSQPIILESIILNISNSHRDGPNFHDPVNGVFDLLINSPAIDAGNNSFAPFFSDIIGNKRIAGDKVDIGAYEYGSEKAVEDYTGTDKEVIINFRSLAINDGEGIDIYGQNRKTPGTYLFDKTDHYVATRLSVVPLQNYERWVPYLQVPTSNSIIVTWKAPAEEEASVFYGIQPDALILKGTGSSEMLSDETATINYKKVKLSGLTPDTKYYYKLEGDPAIYSFKTQPEIGSTRNYRVLVLGDHQIINRSGYEWLIQAATQTLDKKYGNWKDAIDLIINTGDQVDRGTYNYYERCHFYKSSRLSPYLPVMTTLGNHELYDDPDLVKYAKLFHYQNLTYKGISSGTNNYYAFQEGRTLFVMLSTETAHANDVQLNWLKNILREASVDPDIDFVMSSCHRPMCSETYITDYSAWLKKEVVPVLGSCPKHLLNIAAHHHYYQRGQVADYPFFHIISGGASWDQTWGMAPNKYDEGIVQKTFDYWTYQIIDFDPIQKKMKVETYSIGNKNIVHDNKLIDSFTRDLSNNNKPNKPEIRSVEPVVGLPLSIRSSTCEDVDFNTCHFQISNSNDFQNPVIDQYNHRENFFEDEGAPWYTPVNTFKDKSPFELVLPEQSISAGKYYLRVRHRNNNVQWSEWSDVSEFILLGEENHSPALDIQKELFHSSENIDISFENAPTGTKAWIGIYTQGSPTNGTVASKKWSYTNTSSGKISFNGLSAGKYFMVLYADAGYTTITLPLNFAITDEKIGTITIDKSFYEQGEDISVTYMGFPGYAKDWLAVYKQNDEKVPGDKGYTSVLYKYIPLGESNGNASFCDPAKLTDGHYFIGLFLTDGYEEAANRAHFIVGSLPQVTSYKEHYLASEKVVLFINNKPKFPGCELIITEVNGTIPVKRIKLNKNESNSSVFIDLPPGNYTSFLILDGRHIPASTEQSFFVSEETTLPQLKSKSRVRIFPNPTMDFLNIEGDSVSNVELVSLVGNKIPIALQNGQVDIRFLLPGVYHVIIHSESGRHVLSFVKN